MTNKMGGCAHMVPEMETLSHDGVQLQDWPLNIVFFVGQGGSNVCGIFFIRKVSKAARGGVPQLCG